MTVAPWEFWSLANLLISTHGDEAEMEAARRLAAAENEGDSGQKVVWYEVTRKLVEIRAERAERGE
jgi:hypothetical protein